MADVQEIEALTEATPPDQASLSPEPTQAARNGGDDIDRDLAEYDSAVSGDIAPEPSGPTIDDLLEADEAAALPVPYQNGQHAVEALQFADAVEQLRQHGFTLEQHFQQAVHEMQYRELLREADEEGNRVKAEVYERYKNSHAVTKSMIDAWLENTASNDPAFKKAFLERAENPRAYKVHKDRLLQKLDYELMPLSKGSIQATEDRAMVVAAVTKQGSTGGRIPEDPAPNFGQMSNNDLRQHIREVHGFDPGF